MPVSAKSDAFFTSSDKKTAIHYSVWTPELHPKAVIQIVHGMCENVGLYTEFAEFLCSKGYVVCGHDMLGHGENVTEDSIPGHFGDTDGDRYLLSDIEKLRVIMREKYRSLPYILLGHSLGSFAARAYAAAYPEGNLDGLIISGTAGNEKPARLGKSVASIIEKLRGANHSSKLIPFLAFFGYNRRFHSEKRKEYRKLAWTSNDFGLIDEHIPKDGRNECGLTVRGYFDMFCLLRYSQTHYPHPSLPLLMISGKDDPLGGYGKSVGKLYDILYQDLSDVTLKLYDGERHDVLIGKSREKVYEDVHGWIERITDARIGMITQSRET